LNGSIWLKHNALEGLPQSYNPSLHEAFYEGLFGAFLTGDNKLNTNLWTMRWEFYGSMAVFVMTLLLPLVRRFTVLVLLPVAICMFIFTPYMLPFVFGLVGIALDIELIRLPRYAAFLVLAVALYLCGYCFPMGWYRWISAFSISDDYLQVPVLVQTVGGFLLLIVFGSNNVISRVFSGTASRILGTVSFPLYLVHTVIISSLCSMVYIQFPENTSGIVAAGAVLLLVLPPMAWILGRCDEKWVSLLSRWHPAERAF